MSLAGTAELVLLVVRVDDIPLVAPGVREAPPLPVVFRPDCIVARCVWKCLGRNRGNAKVERQCASDSVQAQNRAEKDVIILKLI